MGPQAHIALSDQSGILQMIDGDRPASITGRHREMVQ
jgi:hypothetical protein